MLSIEKKTEFVCENVEWENLPDLVTLTALFYNFTQLDNAIFIYRVFQTDETKCDVSPFICSSNFSVEFGEKVPFETLLIHRSYIARFVTHPLDD